MIYPQLKINLKKIEHNASLISEKCRLRGIEVIGVTKACLGLPEVARAMLKGGVAGIGDSRLENLKRLRQAGINTSLMMLRLPMLSEVAEIVSWADVSLNSEFKTIKALSEEAVRQQRRHQIILMVETGDLREGANPSEVQSLVRKIINLPGIEFIGLGTNVACLEGVTPTPERLNILVKLTGEIEERLTLKVKVISGGNSSAWKLIEEGKLPSRINQVRFGEAILLGQETINFEPIENAYQDAFILEGEIIEARTKSRRYSESKERIIVALGKQDTYAEGLIPLEKAIKVIKASSDHLVLDVSQAKGDFKVGQIISFKLNYDALLRAMTSPYVHKVLL